MARNEEKRQLVSQLALWAQSTTTDYIRAKTNLNLSPIHYANKSELVLQEVSM